ncbi:MAG: hypothetical protein OQJ97_06610 [Rhodospirillales bacterium]|nr:hypothetical protein [Rhodospirillales bacterium]
MVNDETNDTGDGSSEPSGTTPKRRTGISRRFDEDSWRVSLDRREDWELRNTIAQELTDEERDKLRGRLGKARLLPIDRRIGPRDLTGGPRKKDE